MHKTELKLKVASSQHCHLHNYIEMGEGGELGHVKTGLPAERDHYASLAC